MPDWLFFVDDLERVCSSYCLEWWQTVGIWLTGFATLSAVIVSLTLARRAGPQLRVSAGIRLMIPGNAGPDDAPFPEYISIAIRNTGSRPVKIEGVGWRPAWWRKWHAYQTIPPQPGGVTLPHWLREGDSLNLYISLQYGKIDWLTEFAEKFLGSWPALEVRLLRVTVWTPAGHSFTGPVDQGIRRRLLRAVQNTGAEDL